MTVYASKPEINVREKLKELDYGHVPYEKMPIGSIIQVKSTTVTAQEQITAGSGYTQTNCKVKISPRFKSSRMLIIVSAAVFTDLVGTNNDLQGGMAIYKDGSLISGNGKFSIRFVGDSQSYWQHGGYFSLQHVDFPKTLDPIEYQLYLNPSTSNADIYLNVNFGNTSDLSQSVMTVMEIKQ